MAVTHAGVPLAALVPSASAMPTCRVASIAFGAEEVAGGGSEAPSGVASASLAGIGHRATRALVGNLKIDGLTFLFRTAKSARN